MRTRRMVSWTAIAVVWAGLSFCPERGLAYEQRIGTLSLGIQGGAGTLAGSDSWKRGVNQVPYDAYGWSGGLGIRLRYALDRAHAVGVSFEDLRFDRKSGRAATLPHQYQLNNFMVDYYLYFHRRFKSTRYLVLGAGFHRPTFRLSDSESILPGEGWIVNFGGGLEYFLRRPLSIDASLRGYYLRPKGGSATAGELMLGIHYYLLN